MAATFSSVRSRVGSVGEIGNSAGKAFMGVGQGMVDTMGTVLGGDTPEGLQRVLDQKVLETQNLREAAGKLMLEKDKLLATQMEYQEMIEAQEAELARVLDKMPGGNTMLYWKTKLHGVEEARVTLQENQKKGETTLVELRTEIEELQNKVNKTAQEIKDLKLSMEDLEEEDDVSSGFKRTDGPAAFFQRIKVLRDGANLKTLIKDKFENLFVNISPDAKQLIVSKSKKAKKPLLEVNFETVQRVTYPIRTTSKKKKATESAAMTFRVDTDDGNSITFVADSHESLITWYLGVSHLAAGPGESLVDLGGVLWSKTQSKVAEEASTRGISSQQMVADAFSQMLPADAEGEAQEE